MVFEKHIRIESVFLVLDIRFGLQILHWMGIYLAICYTPIWMTSVGMYSFTSNKYLVEGASYIDANKLNPLSMFFILK